MTAPHRPRKRFGQHFLTNPAVIDDIVAAIAPRAGDVIVEIGPGRCAITDPLSRFEVELHAVEFDRDLVQALRLHFAGQRNVHLHEADALKFDLANLGDDLRIVGNLPYNISTPLLFHLLEQREVIRDMHFMLQKEVVDRMAAEPGNKRYGRLTVMLGCFADVQPLFDVMPESFTPPPKVMSSVVALRPKPAGAIEIADPALFKALVTQAFSQRRKTLRNALKGRVDVADLEANGIDPGQRAEQVPIEQWIALADHVAERRGTASDGAFM